MYGTATAVYSLKEAAHGRYLERLESIAERLNGRLSDFKESDAPNMSHYVTDLLAEANMEISGDGVFTSEGPEAGVNVRYVDKHDNQYIRRYSTTAERGNFWPEAGTISSKNSGLA